MQVVMFKGFLSDLLGRSRCSKGLAEHGSYINVVSRHFGFQDSAVSSLLQFSTHFAVPFAKHTRNPRQRKCDKRGHKDNDKWKPRVKPSVRGVRPTQKSLGFEVGEEERKSKKRENANQGPGCPQARPPASISKPFSKP